MNISFLNGVIAQLCLAAGAFPAVYKWFSFIEDRTSPEARKEISAWLKRLEIPNPALTVSNSVAQAYGGLYGSRQFSIRCLWRVALFSTIALLISMTLLGAWKPVLFGPDRFIWTRLVVVMFVFLNIPAEYVAVGTTRLLLSKLRGPAIEMRTGLWLLACDVLVKIVLVILAIVIYSILDNGNLRFRRFSPFDLIQIAISGAFSVINASLLAMLLGSLWIWMYYFSLLLIRKAGRGNVALNWMRWFLDIENQPIRSVGLVTATISTGAYALILLTMQLRAII